MGRGNPAVRFEMFPSQSDDAMEGPGMGGMQ
jgi:hypothetical protein